MVPVRVHGDCVLLPGRAEHGQHPQVRGEARHRAPNRAAVLHLHGDDSVQQSVLEVCGGVVLPGRSIVDHRVQCNFRFHHTGATNVAFRHRVLWARRLRLLAWQQPGASLVVAGCHIRRNVFIFRCHERHLHEEEVPPGEQ